MIAPAEQPAKQWIKILPSSNSLIDKLADLSSCAGHLAIHRCFPDGLQLSTLDVIASALMPKSSVS
jgi:hypothetical protein